MNLEIDKGLITQLRDILKQGWIENTRHGNCGSVGNILEDILGVSENNLPIPDLNEWELKSKRESSSSLVTLFHSEPFPRKYKFVSNILLPKYGWRHKLAGINYPANEMSFRQTINGNRRSDRGFTVVIDRSSQKILISFDRNYVDPRHSEWLKHVEMNVGLGELNPQPYWEFSNIYSSINRKLKNCCLAVADTKVESGKEFFKYTEFKLFTGFSYENFLKGLEEGYIYIDFDARTGHNHGTKFRIQKNKLMTLYANCIDLV
jgi:hypothetical protein